MISTQTLSVGTAAPPREFRIFRAGLNHTEKGDVLFDAQAARDVVAAYARQGVDQMVDLEHASLDAAAKRTRSDAADAVGWYRLALRGGELWAVDVRWNPEGERRLNNKTQRYISPAFLLDRESGRVVELLNCGLVAMPATHGAPALVAASRTPTLGRKSSTVVSTRIPHEVARELALRAAACGVTPGRLLRVLAAAATATAKDRSRLLDLLGLPAEADDAAIRAAVDQLLLDTGEPAPAADAGATASGADNAPPPAVLAAGKDAVERYGAIQLERANRRAATQAGAATLKAHQERRARK